MAFRYEIDEHGALWFFDELNPEPFMHQPTWPDLTPWSDDEASTWAEVLITSLTDETAPLPGNNPAEPKRERVLPVIEVVEETGTDAEVSALIN